MHPTDVALIEQHLNSMAVAAADNSADGIEAGIAADIAFHTSVLTASGKFRADGVRDRN